MSNLSPSGNSNGFLLESKHDENIPYRMVIETTCRHVNEYIGYVHIGCFLHFIHIWVYSFFVFPLMYISLLFVVPHAACPNAKVGEGSAN